MLNETMLLLWDSKPGEGLDIPVGGYGAGGEFTVLSEDGRMGVYQSVRGIIFDCDKREDETDWDSWGCGDCGWGKKCHEETHHT